MTTPPHLEWLVDTGTPILTTEGHLVEVWELQHANESTVLSN